MLLTTKHKILFVFLQDNFLFCFFCMLEQLHDPRLDSYIGNMDTVAESIAAQISDELISVPSLEEIQNEIRPKVKKWAVHLWSQAADWTFVSSFKMWMEAAIGKTAAGVKLSAKERMMYWASVSLTALSYALGSYALYTGDTDYGIVWWKLYLWSWWFFLVAKSKQLLDGLRIVAEKKNIHSLKALLDRYDAIFAGASQKELEYIDKKIQP